MIGEIAIGLTLVVAGSLVVMPLKADVESPLRACLAAPVGAVLYLLIALGMVVTTGTLHTAAALALTALVAAAGFLYGGLRSWNSREALWLAVAVAVALVVVVTTRLVHFTRLSPDSLRYLLASYNLVDSNALGRIHPNDLHVRGFGLPALHALSNLTDRRYLATIGPLFGVSGFALFVGVAWQMTRRMATGPRALLVATAVAFLLSSNRLLYDSFYINTHIFMAVFLFMAVTGIWQAAFLARRGWAAPAGLALAVTVLLRPEAPLVVALILVVAAASPADTPTRLWLGIPSLGVAGVWYGVLWERAPGGDRLAFDAPVFGGLFAVVAGAVLLLAARERLFGRWAGRLDLAMVAAMGAALAIYIAFDPYTFTASLEATIGNLVLLRGHWQVTWPAMLLLIGGALVIGRGPDLRVWAVPVVGYALLWWLLPYLRDGPWRLGTGDSGNRILAHILFVGVAYVILTAAATSTAGEGPASRAE